jgi:hypothetical protein
MELLTVFILVPNTYMHVYLECLCLPCDSYENNNNFRMTACIDYSLYIRSREFSVRWELNINL